MERKMKCKRKKDNMIQVIKMDSENASTKDTTAINDVMESTVIDTKTSKNQ